MEKNQNKLWISSMKIWLPCLLLITFLIGYSMKGNVQESHEEKGHQHSEAGVEAATQWTCSMHPQILLPEPGDCPICGMDLIPLKADSDSGSAGERELRLSETARKLANTQVAEVQRKTVENEISL